MNEKFFALPEEKPHQIIKAAIEVFSKYDYKHASTDLIAAKAGISKGSLFYYFHNKKELYLYLYDYIMDVMKEQLPDRDILNITDFFELLEYAARQKVKVMEQGSPYIMDFAMRAFYSEKEDVSNDLRNHNFVQQDVIYQAYFSHIDASKFKDGISPHEICKMLIWMADGYLHEARMLGQQPDMDVMMAEFTKLMEMFRKFVYKEEYLA